MGRNPALSIVYLVLAVAGAIVPWTYNIRVMQETGGAFPVVEFVTIGFQGPPLLGSVAADFWIGSVAALIWMLVEARRMKMKYWWALFPLTMLVAWACALPFFLFLRERSLSRSA
jgi:hypothetical protein